MSGANSHPTKMLEMFTKILAATIFEFMSGANTVVCERHVFDTWEFLHWEEGLSSSCYCFRSVSKWARYDKDPTIILHLQFWGDNLCKAYLSSATLSCYVCCIADSSFTNGSNGPGKQSASNFRWRWFWTGMWYTAIIQGTFVCFSKVVSKLCQKDVALQFTCSSYSANGLFKKSPNCIFVQFYISRFLMRSSIHFHIDIVQYPFEFLVDCVWCMKTLLWNRIFRCHHIIDSNLLLRGIILTICINSGGWWRLRCVVHHCRRKCNIFPHFIKEIMSIDGRFRQLFIAVISNTHNFLITNEV